jgi:excisionase family DNA binding protein
MTTSEAADRLGIKARSVVWAIRAGHIKAEKRGRDWWIEDAEIERYRRERKPAHRPKATPPADPHPPADGE